MISNHGYADDTHGLINLVWITSYHVMWQAYQSLSGFVREIHPALVIVESNRRLLALVVSSSNDAAQTEYLCSGGV